MPLGERIKTLRTAAGLSQAELADAIGGDGRQISRYENDPDRLEVDTHVLMDALTAGAQAMIEYVDLEGFAVEQRVA